MPNKVRESPERRSLYDNGSESTAVDETTALLSSNGNCNGTSEDGAPNANRGRKPSDAGSDAPRHTLGKLRGSAVILSTWALIFLQGEHDNCLGQG